MKTCNSKTRKGGWAAGFLTIGLPLMAVVIMSGCASFQSIAVTPPEKTVFGQGEAFTYEGIRVASVSKKGETKELRIDPNKSNIRVTGYDPDRIGEQTITVTYRHTSALIQLNGPQEFTSTYTVTVIGVESIAIDQESITAKQGLDIVPDLRFTASYGDKIPPRTVQGDEVAISGYDKDIVGEQAVTADYYGKTVAFPLTVAALTDIKITKPPARTTYFYGEPLDVAGLEVTGVWQGASDAPVTPENISGFDANTQGAQTVIVEALGKQVSFTVTVKEPAEPVTWTPVQGAFSSYSVLYGNGRFVALMGKDIAYSTDGITWTKVPGVIDVSNMIGMVYGNGTFVVAGYESDKNEGYVSDKVSKSIIIYSTDGIAWTRASPPDNYRNRTISFRNGQFVTLGDFRYLKTGSNSEWEISYYQSVSADGINWSDNKPLFSDVAPWESGGPRGKIVSGNGQMIRVGGGGGLAWSNDGIIWTDADEQPGGALYDVAYGFGMFLAVGERGNIIYSRDGYTWKKVAASTFGSTTIRHAVYGAGRFVVFGENGRIAYSNKID